MKVAACLLAFVVPHLDTNRGLKIVLLSHPVLPTILCYIFSKRCGSPVFQGWPINTLFTKDAVLVLIRIPWQAWDFIERVRLEALQLQ